MLWSSIAGTQAGPVTFRLPLPPPQPTVTNEDLAKLCNELATTDPESRFNGLCLKDETTATAQVRGLGGGACSLPECSFPTPSLPRLPDANYPSAPLLPAAPRLSRRPTSRWLSLSKLSRSRARCAAGGFCSTGHFATAGLVQSSADSSLHPLGPACRPTCFR